MKDHSENTLRAAIKSLRDTVTPAVDPSDPQAAEQLRLTIDFLEFLRTRLYDVHARHRYELEHQMVVARSLLKDAHQVSDRVGDAMIRALSTAAAAHADAATHTRDLQAASDSLWGSVRTLVREAAAAPEAVQERISTSILSGMEPLVELESAWYLPFGFEPDPESVTPLADLWSTPSGTAS
ncbi:MULTISPECIES: hypothetical protein [unclassified Nocardioides]|uniref:hypothetical protein n=1 Tax=unclassified Nocardioides TaxID=2615069 RepID=UPI000702971D|nr:MULTISPECIES: hypothetical protein [unclassified Nocardioides]KQZ75654.1 hypothetical protein ASD66_04785 [Nocardioides sp. Root151]KRF14727.1 hypothetical protein ASH02_10570 [Nocardioides sp. Soil796]